MNDLIPVEKNEIVGNSDDLSRVVRKALAQIEAILDMELPDTENSAKFLSIKKDAATAIINAGLKADENRFRRENKDIIERLFDKVRKESKIVDSTVKHRG